MMVQPPQAHNHEKNMTRMGKGWYYRFDDDNKMSYEYIPSITKARMGQLTYNPTYC